MIYSSVGLSKHLAVCVLVHELYSLIWICCSHACIYAVNKTTANIHEAIEIRDKVIKTATTKTKRYNNIYKTDPLFITSNNKIFFLIKWKAREKLSVLFFFYNSLIINKQYGRYTGIVKVLSISSNISGCQITVKKVIGHGHVTTRRADS